MFSKHLFEPAFSSKVLTGFIVFSFVSSIVYILNDISDVESDRQHPVKKKRPIASGAISTGFAYQIALVLGAGVSAIIYFTNWQFGFVVGVYLIVNYFYTKKLKNQVLLDVFSIAAGFMLRVIAGAVIIDVYISSWLILTTMFISLFLAIMKRRSELELVKEESRLGSATRKVLGFYSIEFINQIATITAAAVIICYALYTMSDRTIKVFGTENLIYTTPFVVFGIFRYMFLAYKDKGEDASEILVKDTQMIVNICLYLLSVILIIYKFR
jgi:4-hydroxybenzoate polyprenyltransferase